MRDRHTDGVTDRYVETATETEGGDSRGGGGGGGKRLIER